MPCKEKPMKYTFFIDCGADKWEPITFDIDTSHVLRYKTPAITDVKTINNKVVIVTFADGSSTKAVCDKDDAFNLDIGIGICITKRLMSRDEKAGNSMFNKAIRDAHKVMKRNEELAQAKKELEEEEKRIEAKIQRKKEKRAEKRRQKRVEELADAIALANTRTNN